MTLTRVLELIYFVYFLSHIPISICVDSQVLFPTSVYPQQLRDLLKWYTDDFKDPMMRDTPFWFKSFCVCEMLLQFPFFFVATYAFWKGRCRWVRIPTIIYATHVITTLIPILSHIFLNDFSDSVSIGPTTSEDRLKLASVYLPYLLLPILMLLTMLFDPSYQNQQKTKRN